MTRKRGLDEFPAGRMGWVHAPETIEQYPLCDVIDCETSPEYEIYFVQGESVWYFMCLTHKDYFAARGEPDV